MSQRAGGAKNKIVAYFTPRESIALRRVAQMHTTSISDVVRAAVMMYPPMRDQLLNPGRVIIPTAPPTMPTFGDPTIGDDGDDPNNPFRKKLN